MIRVNGCVTARACVTLQGSVPMLHTKHDAAPHEHITYTCLRHVSRVRICVLCRNDLAGLLHGNKRALFAAILWISQLIIRNPTEPTNGAPLCPVHIRLTVLGSVATPLARAVPWSD